MMECLENQAEEPGLAVGIKKPVKGLMVGGRGAHCSERGWERLGDRRQKAYTEDCCLCGLRVPFPKKTWCSGKRRKHVCRLFQGTAIRTRE